MSKKYHLTGHALKRLEQRAGVTKKIGADRYVKNAFRKGQLVNEFPPGPFQNFLIKKEFKTGKRVRVFRGFIFIFNSSNNGLTTLYKVPKKYIQEYEQYRKE